jgi:FAD/FMN-containing dehydrogenase
LNDALGNKLVAVRPAASVCFPEELDAAACQNVKDLWTDSVWRSSQPGAVQWENWEAWPQQHSQSCYIETANMTCGQGRISLYSAKVNSTSDIQQAVRFAQDHNLRLAIKNTGHDFFGRSTAPESLQILTHDMKDIELVDNFVPSGAPKNKNEGSAVHLAAGVQLPELYAAVGRRNRTVIAGSSHSVGAAGGYIQGGGHSPFGAWKGLASDNALEFELVVANVSVIKNCRQVSQEMS